jgi:hypothetical protein
MDAAEYAARQRRAREAAAARGLRALVSFSRGGGTHDRIADGLWFVGLATAQPFVPDLAGHWRATGHVAVVVPVDGPVTAVVESEELRAAAMADEVVVPTTATCCGFAGDRGFLHPELVEAATAGEAQEVRERHFDAHLCSNRTCEVGLERATGERFESFVYLLEELTRRP